MTTDLARQAAPGHRPAPLLSVLTVHGSPQLLAGTYASLLSQGDRRWEWCVAVAREQLPHGLPLDPRIVTCGPDGGPDGGTGSSRAELLARAFAAATGDHVVRVDPGDQLAEDAVADLAAVVRPGGWGYTDEEQRYPGGRTPDVWEKPEHSPELARSQPYTARTAVLDRSVALQAGGVDPSAGDAAWFDVVLRVGEVSGDPWHLARPVVVRNDPCMTTRYVDGDPESYARVVRAHCERTGVAVRAVEPVVVQARPVGMHLVRDVQRWPSVSIVIPTRGSASVVDGAPRVHVEALVGSIRAGRDYPGRQIVVVADAATPADVLGRLRELGGEELLLLPHDAVDFHFSRKCNEGAVHAGGELLCFLNDDMDVLAPDWLHEMVGHLEDPGVGAVGAQLIFGDGSLQHVGHHYVAGSAGHPLFGWRQNTLALGAAAHVAGERSGVTAACLLMRRVDFDAVGGFSMRYPLNYNDVDLCLKVRERGQRIVYTPHARLRHFESVTREARLAPAETVQLRERWWHRMGADPYLPHSRPTRLRSKFLVPSPGTGPLDPGEVSVPAALDILTEDPDV